MCIKTSILPQANIYSSKTLFDNLEDRNQKRIAQIIKRKKALLLKNKNLNTTIKDKSSEEMITPSTKEISTNINNNILNLSKSEIKQNESDNKIFSSVKPKHEIFSLSFKLESKNTNTINESNNYGINHEDLIEKEINISNLNDNENYIDDINIYEKDKMNIKKKKRIILNDKIHNKINNIKRINENSDLEKINKEKNNIYERNKFAIEFLSSNLVSFVELKNKLVAKAKYSKNYFTLSYSQALFLDYNKKNEKEKAHNYEVNDIIKEENESFSPKSIDKIYLGQSNTMSSKKKKPEKISIKYNSKFQNKSFCKTEENNTEQNKNLIKEYTFNKKSLINNYKFKIPKTKLSMEIRNKRKTFEKKECKNYLDINNRQKSMKSGILSPKFLKMKLFLEQIHKLESNKNKFKDKSKKFRKKEKINGKKNIQ